MLYKQGVTDAASAFDFLDADGGGTISYAELRNALPKLNLTASEATCKRMMREMDTGGDGTVNMDEFLAWQAAVQAEDWTGNLEEFLAWQAKIEANVQDRKDDALEALKVAGNASPQSSSKAPQHLNHNTILYKRGSALAMMPTPSNRARNRRTSVGFDDEWPHDELDATNFRHTAPSRGSVLADTPASPKAGEASPGGGLYAPR